MKIKLDKYSDLNSVEIIYNMMRVNKMINRFVFPVLLELSYNDFLIFLKRKKIIDNFGFKLFKNSIPDLEKDIHLGEMTEILENLNIICCEKIPEYWYSLYILENDILKEKIFEYLLNLVDRDKKIDYIDFHVREIPDDIKNLTIKDKYSNDDLVENILEDIFNLTDDINIIESVKKIKKLINN